MPWNGAFDQSEWTTRKYIKLQKKIVCFFFYLLSAPKCIIDNGRSLSITPHRLARAHVQHCVSRAFATIQRMTGCICQIWLHIEDVNSNRNAIWTLAFSMPMQTYVWSGITVSLPNQFPPYTHSTPFLSRHNWNNVFDSPIATRMRFFFSTFLYLIHLMRHASEWWAQFRAQ